MITLYFHPRCGTCKKVIKMLSVFHNHINLLDLLKEAPSKDLILRLLTESKNPRSVLNTSGQLYRELDMKNRIIINDSNLYFDNKEISHLVDFLYDNPMLLKRPILYDTEADFVCSGSQSIESVYASSSPKLILYMRTSCPYCNVVMEAIEQINNNLNIEIIDLDVRRDQIQYLVEQTGKRQVPCLFIDGEPLLESREIANWILNTNENKICKV